VVHLEVFFFFGNKTFIQQTREPKALQQDKTREGGGSLPLQMGEDGGGGCWGENKWECSPRTLLPRPKKPHGGHKSLHFSEFF
jgi:hypothetical protein